MEALNYIHKTLGVGTVYLSNKYPRASFEVSSQQELRIILAIFARYNLNSAKHLNYLDFCKAFLLYTKDSGREYRSKLKPILLDILSSMNNSRTNFNLTANRKLHITSNWLLGFVEGDGSFSYARGNGKLLLIIIQKGDLPLFNAIRDFLVDLAKEYNVINNLDIDENAINIYSNRTGISRLEVSRSDFLKHILIPLFNSLTFHTKKYLDYCDWVALFNIRQSGFHYLPEGQKLIDRISSQMNNNRLSTSPDFGLKTQKSDSAQSKLVNRAELIADINKLLSMPSNYEHKQDGRTWIKSECKYMWDVKSTVVELIYPDGIIETFHSQTDCAKFLGVSRPTVSLRLVKSRSFLFQNKVCRLKLK